jgi:hypothetical protein
MPGLYTGLTRLWYNYTSDDTVVYIVPLTADDAAAGVFGAAVPYSADSVLPLRYKMRHCYGTSSTGIRTKIPVPTLDSVLWTTPTTFTKRTVVFNAQGLIGETRTARA